MRRLDQAHARSKAELAAHEAQLTELEEQVRQLRREAYVAKGKKKREYTSGPQYEDDSPPSYQEAVNQKEAQVVEKQAVVTMARERTLEEDILIATVPAVFAASKLSICCIDYGRIMILTLVTQWRLLHLVVR